MISPRRTSLSILVILSLLAIPMAAHAVPYSFDNITNNNATDAATGEAQLRMNVQASGGQILFTFTNAGLNPCSITDIYFDDDVPLLSFVRFIQSEGVKYTVGVDSPPNLPGGNDPRFHFTSDYAYDPQNPQPKWGVNPDEYLTIVFNYTDAADFERILTALQNGSLRVGIHVQGFTGGGSESYIDKVPEPSTVLLLGSGLCALALLRARRKRAA